MDSQRKVYSRTFTSEYLNLDINWGQSPECKYNIHEKLSFDHKKLLISLSNLNAKHLQVICSPQRQKCR